jgi:hypothetical protein
MFRPVVLALIVAVSTHAQEDPTDLLSRVRQRVAGTLDHLPRYMCTETIDRSQFDPDLRDRGRSCDDGSEPAGTHLATWDRLRLDVGMAAAREMYSWVGEKNFDNRDLLDIVNEGAISTGSYAAFLTAIFRSEDATFSYEGETVDRERRLTNFSFQVPYEKSHYFYGQGQHRVVTGYTGTFLVDSKSADLVRLSVRTSQLAPETGACYASTDLDYDHVELKGREFLLPHTARLRIVHPDGGQSENRTAFSNCHEFLGESKLSFEEPVLQSEAGGSAAGVNIPSGLPFRIALTESIDTTTVAAGDPVHAKLITPIADKGKARIPAGAEVLVRIVRIRHFEGKAPYLVLDIKIDSVNIAGVRTELPAAPAPVGGFQKSKNGDLQRRVELGTLRGIEARSTQFVFRDLHSASPIPAGLESSWVTKTK